MTQRGRLTDGQERRLREIVEDWRLLEATLAEHRGEIARFVGLSSYREVARITGFSTNTLQRWKREAGK